MSLGTSISDAGGVPGKAEVDSQGCQEYRPVPSAELFNEVFVDSAGEAQHFVNAVNALYMQNRRIGQVVPSYFPTDSTGMDMVLDVGANWGKTIRTINTKGMLTGAAKRIKAWIFYQTDGANTLNLHLECGRHRGVTESIESVSWAWASVECEVDPVTRTNLKRNQNLNLFVTAGDTAVQITIRSISIHEMGDTAAPDFIDTSGASNVLGEDDFPYSSAMCYVLNNNIKAVRAWRLPQTNIMNHCMTDPVKAVSGSFDGDYRGLGQYIIRKSKGWTEINGMVGLIIDTGGAGGTAELSFRIYTTAGVYVAGDLVDVTANGYYTFNVTGLSSAETEYELRIDAREKVYRIDTVQILEVFAADDIANASPYHDDTPKLGDVMSEDDVVSNTWLHAKQVLEQIWFDGGKTLLNDYRWDTSALDGNFYPVLSRGLLFPTYGSKWLHFRMDLRKPTQEKTGMLAYDGRAGNFTDGLILIGASSGATAYITYHTGDGAATGVLYLRGINGAFIDNEALSDSGGGSANANGLVDTITGQVVEVRTMITPTYPSWTAGTMYAKETIDITDKPGERVFTIESRLPIPAEYWNDHSKHGAYPICFEFLTRTTIDGTEVTGTGLADGDAVDYTQLIQSHIYEEAG